MDEHRVIFTTNDGEVVYPVKTNRGALAAVEAATFVHYRNGHAPSTVSAVRTEQRWGSAPAKREGHDDGNDV